jgi:hypothetical protein
MISFDFSPFNAVDKSDGKYSDCSSIQQNENDVTVVKRKASTPAKPLPKQTTSDANMDQGNDETPNTKRMGMTTKRTRNQNKAKLAQTMTYTVEGVLEKWNDTTEYGITFRALSNEEQLSEVQVLNKGAAKGMKGMLKTKMLAGNYKKLLADKLREHLCASRVAPSSMFHCVSKDVNVMLVNPSFMSVGEWVEVD